jgi:hypothetical protein
LPLAKLRFLVSLITKDNDYQCEQAAATSSAAGQFGVDVEIVYAENDAITQSTQTLKVIQADPTFRQRPSLLSLSVPPLSPGWPELLPVAASVGPCSTAKRKSFQDSHRFDQRAK